MISHYLIKPNTVTDEDIDEISSFIRKNFFAAYSNKSIRLTMHTGGERYSTQLFQEADDYYLAIDSEHSEYLISDKAYMLLEYMEFTLPKGSYSQLDEVFKNTSKGSVTIFIDTDLGVMYFKLSKNDFEELDISPADWSRYTTVSLTNVEYHMHGRDTLSRDARDLPLLAKADEYPISIKEAHSPQAVKTYRLLLISTLK